MHILIAEDERITRAGLVRQLEGWGHTVSAVENGQAAWEQLRARDFELVLTDWEMPRLSGVELIQKIREAHRPDYVYIILLTSRSDKSDVVQGIEAGADDFVSKPFDRDELRVRLLAGQRVVRLERAISRASQRMKRDLDAAARVQRTLLPDQLPEAPGLSFAWSYRPCDELAGDALNVVRINDDLIAVYLLDVSGHGVPAALLSVTATRSLHPRGASAASIVTGPGASPEPIGPVRVASMLNQLYPIASNGGHYFTMIYGLLSISARRFRFTVAGHPAPIVAPAAGQPRRLDVNGFPIGMIEAVEYEESAIELQPGDRLYLHSDGLTEEANAQNEQFGDERLLAAIAEGRALNLGGAVQLLVKKVVAWHGEDHLRDDVSVVAIAAE